MIRTRSRPVLVPLSAVWPVVPQEVRPLVLQLED
jgi:hypothetical protein